jgi:hypothetical protein
LDIYFSTYYASENIFRAYPNATSTSTYNIKQAAGTSVSSRACANSTYYM